MSKEYCIYRFLDENNQVIYIGRTSNGIRQRISQHLNNGHLHKNVYEQIRRVDFMHCKTKEDSIIKEIYYICKYKPKYNSSNKGDVSFYINEDSDIWCYYTYFKQQEYNLVNRELQDSKNKINDIKREHEMEMNRTINYYKSIISKLETDLVVKDILLRDALKV